MNRLSLLLLSLQCLILASGQHVKRESITDNGDHFLICSQEPIDFGIVLDSSSSITPEDFEKARKFLVQFLEQFDIGGGPNDVRVSIITFGKGIFPQDGFDLDTYSDKAEVLKHIADIKHRATPYTDTGLAIQYMHDHQLTPANVRPNAEKISLVVTDGNSQRWSLTRDQAKIARQDNITMFALGIGSARSVGKRELLRIAGDDSRVTRVDNFDDLDAVKEVLAKKTCIRKEKPTTTTTPVPMIQSCGELNPADIEFIFSPADMGIDGTAWTTSFIANTIDSEDLDQGFRYGVKSGSCPDDEGFPLDAYDNLDDIKERLSLYDRVKLPHLVTDDLFSAARGGRNTARDVAVIFVGNPKGMKGGELEAKVVELEAKGVKVYIGNPAGYPFSVGNATPLMGRSSRQQSESLVNMLCPK